MVERKRLPYASGSTMRKDASPVDVIFERVNDLAHFMSS